MASASWLSKVERFFRDLTVNPVRRRVFTSVPDLVGGIDEYLIEHNGHDRQSMNCTPLDRG